MFLLSFFMYGIYLSAQIRVEKKHVTNRTVRSLGMWTMAGFSGATNTLNKQGNIIPSDFSCF